jgi:hypothetical protein
VTDRNLSTQTSNIDITKRQYGFSDLICAHDHLKMSEECNSKKKAAGDKGIVADLLGLSLVGGPKAAA